MVAAVPIILLVSQMPPIEGFITSLLEMRSHYQAQINQYDRLIAQAQEGLAHVNALLVDETLDNQQFTGSLLQMRSHYQATVDEQKSQAATALEQLVHINALLAEQMVVQHGNEQAISMQARTYRDNLALAEVNQSKELPLAVEQLEIEPAAQEQVQSVEPPVVQEVTSEPEQTNSTGTFPENQFEEVKQNQPQSSVADELPAQEIEAPQVNKVSKTQLTKTPLLPQYQHLTRSEAVEKLLQENIGTILHTDYIVRSLYGNLEAEAFKVEKQRLYETLGKGVAKGLWDKVPDQPGCYTVDIKLVEREIKPTGTKQANEPETTKSVEVLPAYQHLNYTQAVETVLRENVGQVMDSEKVVKILYGNLEAKDLSKVKDKIGKILWAGARQKHWQKVAGKLGAYIAITK